MNYKAESPEQYIEQLPESRKDPVTRLREIIAENLPREFTETMAYDMISYVIPHSIYPKGYHADPKQPVPFISLASQKNHIAVYHMGLYAMPDVLAWFEDEYAMSAAGILDMGKSCIRFKNVEKIPYDLLARLCRKISAESFLQVYDPQFKRNPHEDASIEEIIKHESCSTEATKRR